MAEPDWPLVVWDIRNGLTGRLSTEMSFPSKALAEEQIRQWIERGRNGGRPDVPMWKLMGLVPVRRVGPRAEDDEIVPAKQELQESEIGEKLAPAALAYIERLSTLSSDQLALMIFRLKRQLADPPEGWFTFGHHVGQQHRGVKLETWGTDEDGMPLWERAEGD